ncbi:MAG: hypothetical protein WCA35_09210 [Kovacikia sp.]
MNHDPSTYSCCCCTTPYIKEYFSWFSTNCRNLQKQFSICSRFVWLGICAAYPEKSPDEPWHIVAFSYAWF